MDKIKCASNIDFCQCGHPKYKVAEKCAACRGRRATKFPVKKCPVCNDLFYCETSPAKKGRKLFCSVPCRCKGHYFLATASRFKISPEEFSNYLKAGLRWCSIGKHWAHTSDFWADRTHRTFMSKHTYCKHCYSKKYSTPNARWNVTKSDSWKPEFLRWLEILGSENRALMKVKVSWPTLTRRKMDPAFNRAVIDAKNRFSLKNYGTIRKYQRVWHKHSYESNPLNPQTFAFYEANKKLVEGWMISAAVLEKNKLSQAQYGQIVKRAVLCFCYTGFYGDIKYERLAKYYGRVAVYGEIKKPVR